MALGLRFMGKQANFALPDVTNLRDEKSSTHFPADPSGLGGPNRSATGHHLSKDLADKLLRRLRQVFRHIAG